MDTLTILSAKEEFEKNYHYKKIKVGKSYDFILKEVPTYTENLVIRCGKNVFWKSGDDPKKMPYFAYNIRDIYIKDIE